jgi:S-adenosylmethionine decarboxylase
MQNNAYEPTCKNIGCEWIVDAFDCIPDRLRDLTTMQRLCEAIIRDLLLHVVGEPRWHSFPGEGGVTGLYLLSESHLACHTYPEYGTATFNLVCCRDLPEWPYEAMFQRELGAGHCDVLVIPRGVRRDRSATGLSSTNASQWESTR